jgi:hypothetical protein
MAQEVEVTANRLVGRQLHGVRYYEIPFGLTDTRPWDHAIAHVLDYGLDLETDQGIVGITWAQYESFGYALDIVAFPLLDVRANEVQVSRVEEHPPWDRLLGPVIRRVEIEWYENPWGGEPESAPVALSLQFESGESPAVVCGGWNGPDQPIFPTGNDIVALWRPECLPSLVPYLTNQLLGPPA